MDHERTWPAHLEVDRGKIREFAAATGLRAYDPDLAPPTFTAVLNHWGLSVRDVMEDLGYDIVRVVHGEETIRYPSGPLQAGEVLDGVIRVLSIERKDGRSGPMDLVRLCLEFTRPDGSVAVVVDRDLLVLGGSRVVS